MRASSVPRICAVPRVLAQHAWLVNQAEIYLVAVPAEAPDSMSGMALQAVLWEHLCLKPGHCKVHFGYRPSQCNRVAPVPARLAARTFILCCNVRTNAAACFANPNNHFYPKEYFRFRPPSFKYVTLLLHASAGIARDFSVKDHHAWYLPRRIHLYRTGSNPFTIT